MTLMEATEFVKCTKCGNEYPLSQFPTDKRAKTGHRTICRDCFNARQNELNAQKKQLKTDNPLSTFTSRELIEELRRRNYKGKLYLMQEVVI